MAINWKIDEKIAGRWEIYAIDKSGMDIVYIVYDHLLREPLAAKTFRGRLSAKASARLEQEALIWINLDVHQNVTQAKLVENVEGKPLLFLEYVSGGDLDSWIGTPRLMQDLPQVLRFAIQICDGMRHALSRGLHAHRDIKPGNCLITPDNTLKVTDFGLARWSARRAGEGGQGGTPEYMPPEQWDNFEQADARADIYSFGVTLFEMLSGELPFSKRSRIAESELERRHREDTVPVLADQPPILNTIIATCMAKDPAQRFADFDTLRAQLAQFYQQLTGETAAQAADGAALDATQWNDKGASLRALGRDAEAIVCYERALEIDPKLEFSWSNRGEVLWSAGRTDEAFACFARALEINPDNAQVWSNQAGALMALGQSDASLSSSERALELNPHLAMAWNNRALAYLALGRVEASLSDFARALELNPELEHAWMNRGTALGAAGRVEEELACYDRALELNPRRAETWSNKGVVLAGLERWPDALKCYERALKLNPQHADSWFNKGVALQKSGEPRRSLSCFKRALELNPHDAEALAYQGLSRALLGQFPTAIACYDAALELDAHAAEVWFNKGAALVEMGQLGAARDCFETARQMGEARAEVALADLAGQE